MFREQHTIQLPQTLGSLVCAANKYRATCKCTASSPRCDGLILVFAHCTSAHKEQWEPSIEKLFELAAASDSVNICEAWSIDCTNHGDSALLNESKLSDKSPITIKDYGALLRYVVNSELFAGRSRVVGVGHSSSTSAWCLASSLEDLPLPLANLSSLILVEPVMVPPPILEKDPRIEIGKKNVQGVLSRRDRWNTPDEAREWLGRRFPYKIWDPRIIDIYLKYGFHEVANATDATKTQLTYKCKLSQEVGFYTHEDHVLAGEKTAVMCGRAPVHAIFGERPEMVSLKSRGIICDVSRGRKMASTSIVPGAGHLAVQENPDGVALAIFEVLSKNDIPKRAPTSASCVPKASL